MLNKQAKAVILAALLSSGLFVAVLSLGLGFLFLFLPTLPLFSAGLGKRPQDAFQAAGLAALIIAALTSFTMAAIFLLLFALPVWYMCHTALMAHDITLGEALDGLQLRLWFPIGISMLHVTLYGCALLALVTASFSLQGTTLPHLLASDIAKQLADMEKTYGLDMDISAEQLAFMVCGFIGWLWCAGLWSHGWLANRALAKRQLSRRPTLAIAPFFMPPWMLTLLGLCALASLAGGESLAFLGRASLIMLLLPYFFLGTSLLHHFTSGWPNRRFLLFFIYFCILTQFWPALLLSGAGLWHQIKTLNKHLSAGGTSSR